VTEEQTIEVGIETASPHGAIAVVDGDAVLVEHDWTVVGTYSLELLAALDGTLAEAGVTRQQIAAIAVDVGPGGYGGLRTGVATAQGLAFALDIPLAGVSRLESAALAHLDGAIAVVAVHDAGGRSNRVAWAAFEAGDGAPHALIEPRLDDIDDCLRLAPPHARWCGELTEALRAALAVARPDDPLAPPAPLRAADLVRLARAHDGYGDPAAVDVLYVRPPPITRPARA
jgi:tRNA threonylcarbamoyladenosine biosynthesis protein TsaB